MQPKVFSRASVINNWALTQIHYPHGQRHVSSTVKKNAIYLQLPSRTSAYRDEESNWPLSPKAGTAPSKEGLRQCSPEHHCVKQASIWLNLHGLKACLDNWIEGDLPAITPLPNFSPCSNKCCTCCGVMPNLSRRIALHVSSCQSCIAMWIAMVQFL